MSTPYPLFSQVGALISGPLIDILRKYLPGDDVLADGEVPEENILSFTWTPYRATLCVGLVLSCFELFLALFLNEIKVEEEMTGGESPGSSITNSPTAANIASPRGETTDELETSTVLSSTSSQLRTKAFVPSSTPALDSLKETFTSSSFWRFVTGELTTVEHASSHCSTSQTMHNYIVFLSWFHCDKHADDLPSS